jgi:hypothetical protein
LRRIIICHKQKQKRPFRMPALKAITIVKIKNEFINTNAHFILVGSPPIFYVYIGYPLLVYLVSRTRPKRLI